MEEMMEEKTNFKLTVLKEGEGVFEVQPTTKHMRVLMLSAGGESATDECDGRCGASTIFGDYEVKGGKGGKKPCEGGHGGNLLEFSVITIKQTYNYVVAYSPQTEQWGGAGLIIVNEYLRIPTSL